MSPLLALLAAWAVPAAALRSIGADCYQRFPVSTSHAARSGPLCRSTAWCRRCHVLRFVWHVPAAVE